MTPNHDLFRKLFAVCSEVVDTYDYLPDAGTKYPFVYIGENLGSDKLPNEVYGTLGQTIHLYGLRTDRAKLERLTAMLDLGAREMTTGGYYHLQHQATNRQTIPDNTDVQPLLHIVLDFTFDYTKKEA